MGLFSLFLIKPKPFPLVLQTNSEDTLICMCPKSSFSHSALCSESDLYVSLFQVDPWEVYKWEKRSHVSNFGFHWDAWSLIQENPLSSMAGNKQVHHTWDAHKSFPAPTTATDQSFVQFLSPLIRCFVSGWFCIGCCFYGFPWKHGFDDVFQ